MNCCNFRKQSNSESELFCLNNLVIYSCHCICFRLSLFSDINVLAIFIRCGEIFNYSFTKTHVTFAAVLLICGGLNQQVCRFSVKPCIISVIKSPRRTLDRHFITSRSFREILFIETSGIKTESRIDKEAIKPKTRSIRQAASIELRLRASIRSRG